MEADGGGPSIGQGQGDWRVQFRGSVAPEVVQDLEDRPGCQSGKSRSCLWLLADAVDGQVELHPYNPSHELKKYCDSHGILLQAYCPLGSTGTSKPNSCDPALTDVSRLTLAERRGTAGDRRQAFRSNLHHPHLMVRQPGRHRPPQIGHTFT